jgi:hypothetical protein
MRTFGVWLINKNQSFTYDKTQDHSLQTDSAWQTWPVHCTFNLCKGTKKCENLNDQKIRKDCGQSIESMAALLHNYTMHT